MEFLGSYKKKKKKERKEEKRKRKGGIKKEEESCVEERRKKNKKIIIKEHHFPSRYPANRWSKLIGARCKVGLRDKGYEWVPKSEFFVEVPKGRGSYIGYFLPSGHVRTILVQL